MTYMILDCETIPSEKIITSNPPEDWLIKGMGNRRDPEKVKAKRDENAENWAAESIRRGSLDWRHGQIAAIGVFPEHAEDPVVFIGDELDILSDFWTWFNTTRPDQTVGFNLRSFDIPWIRGRSFVHGITTPGCWHGGRYDTRQVVDWMDILCSYGAFQLKGWTLDAYVDEFCVNAPKAYGEGSDVYGWWMDGRVDEIVKHLTADLRRTDALHERASAVFL